jgi:hypothetical protein
MMVLPSALVSGISLILSASAEEKGEPALAIKVVTHTFRPAQRDRTIDFGFARLCGIVQARDGSLLVSDDANGAIYRVAYSNRDQARTASAAIDR